MAMPQKHRKTTRPSRIRSHKLSSPSPKFDFIFAILVILLTLFGLLMVFDASVVEAYQQFGDKFHFVRLQAIWAGVGILAMLLATFIPHRLYQQLSLPIFIGSLFLLILVLIPGIGTKVQGARRWIDLGFTVLQPSELAKLASIIYFSSWLSRHQRFLPFIVITGTLVGLIILEPDLGTAVIISLIAFTLYYVSGARIKYLSFIGLGGLLIGAVLILASPYRLNRLKTFLDPTHDPLGASYHIRQILIALGSGGISGQGIGRSRQKYQYLPEATTDSIFAIIAEETGFIGGFLVIVALLIIINRSFKIAARTKDRFSQLLATGITSWLTLQIVINLSAMVALLPLTGVPLPFISYGGSSLVTFLFASGILLNISRSK